MPQTQPQFATAYQPSPLPDLSDAATRARLTPGAVKGVLAIFEKWNLTAEQGCALLGGISRAKYYGLRSDPGKALDQDRLQRVSLLVGIYKALNILYSERLANAWPGLANANPLFQGGPPLEYMIRGGIPAMQTVRRLLDARRGGM